MNPLEEIGLARARGGVFYLYGEDEFRKDEAVRALVDAHLDPATRDFNFDPLRGGDVEPEQLASVIATPPMMAEWRVVVVREVEALAASSRFRQILTDAAESPPPGLALILSCTVPDRSKAKFYREMARLAQSVEFRSVSGADVPGWLMERARSVYGLEVEVEAAQALSAAIGANLGILSMELQKLRDVVGEGQRVTLADVEAAGTALPVQDRWRWFDMVGQGRFEEALDALDVLLAQGESAVGLIIGLTTHMLRLGVVVEDGASALEPLLPPHQRWLAKNVARQAGGCRGVEVDAALEGLLRADRLAKAAPVSDRHLLEEWLLTLLARRRAA